MTKTPQRPFRTQTREISDEAAAELGVLPASEALQRIRSHGRGMGFEDLLNWMGHPDERVALEAMTEGHRILARLNPAPMKIVESRADHEVGVWTPLVDAAARYVREPDRAYQTQLARWLRTASADEAAEILSFEHTLPTWIAAKELRDWSPEMVRGVGTRPWNHIERLGRNKHLSDRASVLALFDLAVEQVLGARSIAGARPSGNAIAHLFARGAPLPEDAVERLIQTVSGWQGREGKGVSVVASLARAIGFSPKLTAEQAHRALDAARGRVDVVSAYVEGPRVPPEVVLRALRETPRLQVRRSVIKRADLLRVPEIRAELERSDCANIRTALIETAAPEEATRHLRRLGERNPHRALEAIESHMPKGAAVPIETAATLLGSDWDHVRERALRVVSKHPLAPAQAPEARAERDGRGPLPEEALERDASCQRKR